MIEVPLQSRFYPRVDRPSLTLDPTQDNIAEDGALSFQGLANKSSTHVRLILGTPVSLILGIPVTPTLDPKKDNFAEDGTVSFQE